MQRRPGKYHDDEDRNEAEAHRDKARKNPRNREDELWDIHLLDQRSVLQDGIHRHIRGFIEERPQGLTADQIQRIVIDLKAEHVREDDGHHRHHHERIEQTPQIAQHAAAVFHFKVAGDEYLQQWIILIEMLYGIFHKLSMTSLCLIWNLHHHLNFLLLKTVSFSSAFSVFWSAFL